MPIFLVAGNILNTIDKFGKNSIVKYVKIKTKTYPLPTLLNRKENK